MQLAMTDECPILLQRVRNSGETASSEQSEILDASWLSGGFFSPLQHETQAVKMK